MLPTFFSILPINFHNFVRKIAMFSCNNISVILLILKIISVNFVLKGRNCFKIKIKKNILLGTDRCEAQLLYYPTTLLSYYYPMSFYYPIMPYYLALGKRSTKQDSFENLIDEKLKSDDETR